MMNKNENKKIPEAPADEALVGEAVSDEALSDEELDEVAGGKSVIIQNFTDGDKDRGGIV